MTDEPVTVLDLERTCDDAFLAGMSRSLRRSSRDPDGILALRVDGDVNDPPSSADPEEAVRRAGEVVGPAVERLVRTPWIVTARVTGHVSGTAATLVLAADVVVAGPRAALSPFPTDGPCAPGTGWLLARALPRLQRVDLALGGRSVAAAEAFELGLVTAVVDDPDAELARRHRELLEPGVSRSRVRLRAAAGGPDSTRDLEAAWAHDVQLAALGIP